jgi:hypothetical protein
MTALEPVQPPAGAEGDLSWHQRELGEAHKTIRSLLRQLSKEQARYAETVRAYNLTVANLVEITRENTALTRERDMWRSRAERGERNLSFGNASFSLTTEEVGAIRKAMAKLHHPDVGGDPERMKQWNALLDPLEGS